MSTYGGQAKLRVGPSYRANRSGEGKLLKTGRLPLADVEWLSEILEEILQAMKDGSNPSKY